MHLCSACNRCTTNALDDDHDDDDDDMTASLTLCASQRSGEYCRIQSCPCFPCPKASPPLASGSASCSPCSHHTRHHNM